MELSIMVEKGRTFLPLLSENEEAPLEDSVEKILY